MNTSISTLRDRRLALHARHLIAYAESVPSFGHTLAATIRGYDWVPLLDCRERCQYLTPLDERAAHQQASWLLATLTHSNEYIETRGILAAWADGHDLPENAVIGIIGIAIMGPTLGIIDSPKKKKKKMLLVLSHETYERHSKEELASLVASSSHRLLAKELRIADGNIGALHPETATWQVEGGDVGILRASGAELERLTEIAELEGLPFHLEVSLDAHIIALSPCIDESFVDEVDATRLR